jgi:hypothetical protein
MDQRILLGAALALAVLGGTMGSYLLLKRPQIAPPVVAQPAVLENDPALADPTPAAVKMIQKEYGPQVASEWVPLTGYHAAPLQEVKWLVSCEFDKEIGRFSFHPPTEIATFKTLRALDLSLTKGLSDGLISAIGDLATLQTLDLSATSTRDVHLKKIANLRELRSLRLMGTRVTDACLTDLARLRSLRELDLGDTELTDEGLAWLRGALPDCKIAHDK